MNEMIIPRCTTNYESEALRLYESLPCQMISFLISQKRRTEKSAASEACMPSLPTMPRPTSAFWIMATSLPPSPMHAITLPVLSLMLTATIAFYVGLHRQTQTVLAYCVTLKNFWHNCSSETITLSVPPSIINICVDVRFS